MRRIVALALIAVTIAAVWLWGGATESALGGQSGPACQRAKDAMDQGDYDAAIAELDEAVRLEPGRAECHGLRGVARLRKGLYAEGAADLLAAVKLNPGDAGADYQPNRNTELPAKMMQHGRNQVSAMLRDRRAMAEYGAETEFLETWAARKFAGEDFGALIDWNPEPPLHSDAEHLAPGDDDHAAILVSAVYDCGPRRGQPRSFEELWAGAVYELHNVNFAHEFVRLNEEADEGRIGKRAFVAGILKYELIAAQQTRAFYLQVFLPWVEKKKLPTNPTLWFCQWWDTPESALDSFSDKTSYPWRPYARIHDWATVDRHWRQENFDKAIRLLNRMLKEEGYEDEQDEVRYWLNRCRQKQAEGEIN